MSACFSGYYTLGLNTIYYGTIHERRKEYKLSNTIAKVEQRTKEWHTDHRNRVTEAEQHFESRSDRGKKPKGKSIK